MLNAQNAWQTGELPLWLVTVVETFGSSPHPPGAMLALRGDGLAVGSVSGGCIEDNLMLCAQRGQLSNDRGPVFRATLRRVHAPVVGAGIDTA